MKISLMGLQRFNEAIDALQTAARLSGRHPWPLGDICWAYILSGNVSEAQQVLNELIKRSETEYISAASIAIAACSLNQYDLAIHYLQQALEQRDGTSVALNVWPSFAPLKTDPCFKNFLAQMNFPKKELLT